MSLPLVRVLFMMANIVLSVEQRSQKTSTFENFEHFSTSDMQQPAVCVFVVEHRFIFLITKQTKSMYHMLCFVKTELFKRLLGDSKPSIRLKVPYCTYFQNFVFRPRTPEQQ